MAVAAPTIINSKICFIMIISVTISNLKQPPLCYSLAPLSLHLTLLSPYRYTYSFSNPSDLAHQYVFCDEQQFFAFGQQKHVHEQPLLSFFRLFVLL